MSGKRAAARELNHDNWDDDDAAEEAGTFKQADAAELKNRVIKKAARRVVAADREELANKPPLFTGFAGFNIPTAPKADAFSFNKSTKENTATSTTVSFKGFGSSNGNSKPAGSSPVKSASPQKNENLSEASEDANTSKYLGALKVLNESMIKWLTTSTEKNPYCYFTPVFVDYARHLTDLKAKYKYNDSKAGSTSASHKSQPAQAETVRTSPVKKAEPAIAPVAVPALASESPAPKFTFGSTTKTNSESKTFGEEVKSSPVSFTASFGAKAVSSAPSGDSPQTSTKTPLFSFGVKPAASSTDSESKTEDSSKSSTETSEKPASAPLFSFGTKPVDTSSSLNPTGSIFGPSSSTSGAFTFGTKPAAGATPMFSFGKPAVSSEKPSTGLTFGAGAAVATGGFSFKSAIANASAADNAASATSGAADEEEYVPPKAEVEKKITEDDAVYTKRVKLFYEKEGKYVDKGVGNLFIKPLESGKHSLLIRADTNLGNILLNISLAESLPVKRMGKNNVTLVCRANPPMEAKAKDATAPTMLLVRVKTEQDADELKEKLDHYKKD